MSKPIQLDEIDRRILDLLHADGRMAFTAIAKELGISEATVRKRVNRLTDEGVLHIVGVVNPAYIGRPVTAIVGVHTEGQDVDEIVSKLLEWSEVRHASVCAGTYDLMLEVNVESNEALFHFLTKRLRAVPGVVGSDTSLVMKVVKDRFPTKGGQTSSSDSEDDPS